jgi:von Willebrand factor type A domain
MNCNLLELDLKKVTFLSVAAIAVTCGFTSATKAATLADIAFIIDTSGSMSGDITEVRNRIIDFDRALVDNGIDAQYGLTLFGSGENFVQNLTDFSNFNRPTGALQTFNIGGGTESGSAATQVSLNNSSFRSNYR